MFDEVVKQFLDRLIGEEDLSFATSPAGDEPDSTPPDNGFDPESGRRRRFESLDPGP